MPDKKVKSRIQSGVGLLQKAFQLLDLFQADSPAWSQAELARATGLPRSTTGRLVRYLTESGYLIHTDRSGRYLLGPAAVDLGRRASATFDLSEIGRPVLERLAKAFNETVILTALDDTRKAVACVDQIESTLEGLRVFERIGSRFPLHAGAAPKAVLAFLPDEERERALSSVLEATTSKTLTDPERLRQDLKQTVERGYAVSQEETYLGVIGVAAPFFGSDGRPLGSFAAAAPMHRMSEEQVRVFGTILRAAADEVTSILRGERDKIGRQTTL